MKLLAVFKPLSVVAALVVAANVEASTPLPQGAPGIYYTTGTTFEEFTVAVTQLSSLSGGLGGASSIPGFSNIAFTGLSLFDASSQLVLPTLVSGLQSSSATFLYNALGAGTYTLKLTGGTGAGQGLYSIYGNLAPVPEPESYAMFLAGLGVIGVVATRRRKSI